MFHRLRRIAPHMWPSKSLRLQLLALLCVILLFVGRFLNAAVPVAFGKVVEILETKQGSPWIFLAIYIALRYLQSMGGLRSLIRILWLPVMQYSERGQSRAEAVILPINLVYRNDPARFRPHPSPLVFMAFTSQNR